jgi:hypothetical protein
MMAEILDFAAARGRRDAQVRILADVIRLGMAGVDTSMFFDLLASTELFAEFRECA